MAGSAAPTIPLAIKTSLLHPPKKPGFSVFSTRRRLPPLIPETCLHRLNSRGPPITARVVSKTDETLFVEKEEEESSEPNKIKDCWREMLGQDDWAGLLDPMNPLLRSELIRYGSKAQACYDAFESDPSSRYYGSSRFAGREFYRRLDMAEAGYNISRFLYATSSVKLPNFFYKSRHPKVWSKNATWIGYIAVSDDQMSKKLGRRDVCIVWRGTVTKLEWIADMMSFLRPVSSDKLACPDSTVRVESGFLDLYTDKEEGNKYCNLSVREQILAEIDTLVNSKYVDEEVSITVTGHSLGGALAVLSAYDIAETGIVNRKSRSADVPICVFSFASPRVGNARFKERVELVGVKVLRVVNVHDIVPKSPGFLVNEKVHPIIQKVAAEFPWSYSHVGVEIALDHLNSPFLRPDGDLVCAHNLEAHLHLLDGYHGKDESFELTSERDYALVNKASDFLKDEYGIIPNWRQDHNKGMIFKDGRWMQDDRTDHDDHTPSSCS